MAEASAIPSAYINFSEGVLGISLEYELKRIGYTPKLKLSSNWERKTVCRIDYEKVDNTKNNEVINEEKCLISPQ